MPLAPLPRRRATAGLLGGVVVLGTGLAGCGAAGSPPDVHRSGAADPDTDLLAEARTQVAARLELVRRTARRHPSLRSRLRPLIDLHREHEAVLDPGGTSPASGGLPPTVPARPAAALDAVLRQERSLQDELASLAVRSRSGPLARLLASTAAGTAQRLTLLGPEGGEG